MKQAESIPFSCIQKDILQDKLDGMCTSSSMPIVQLTHEHAYPLISSPQISENTLSPLAICVAT